MTSMIQLMYPGIMKNVNISTGEAFWQIMLFEKALNLLNQDHMNFYII